VESEEHGHQNTSRRIEHVSNLNRNVFGQLRLIFWLCGVIVSIERPLHTFKPSISHGDGDEVSDDEHIDQQ